MLGSVSSRSHLVKDLRKRGEVWKRWLRGRGQARSESDLREREPRQAVLWGYILCPAPHQCHVIWTSDTCALWWYGGRSTLWRGEEEKRFMTRGVNRSDQDCIFIQHHTGVGPILRAHGLCVLLSLLLKTSFHNMTSFVSFLSRHVLVYLEKHLQGKVVWRHQLLQ